MNEVKPPKKSLLYYYAIVLLVVMLFNFLAMPWMAEHQIREVDYNTFVSMVESAQVGQAEIQEQDNRILFTDKDGNTVYKTAMVPDADLTKRLLEAGVSTTGVEIEQTSLLVSLLGWILPLVVFIALGQFMSRKMMQKMGGPNAMAFGKSNAKVYVKSSEGIKFADVAGEDEAKENLQEIVDYLHDPTRYKEIGASMPNGVLLVGPPGTGKTLLARAVAGEADVQFLSISGSDFVEMYVGVGASRVRDLFEQAKKMAPAIVFIDEIDAVGRKRGTGLGGGHDEKEQTLNQLLVEMDGFGRTEGVIVLAATNRPDILDPALLRPGRFDRQIQVGRPDVKGREEILKVHAKGKKLDDSVDLSVIARSTAGFTGADLSNLLNEAAIMAARDNRPVLNMEDINEAMMKIVAGPAKHSHVPSRKDLKTTAIHEAGHAVAMYRLPTHDPVRQISIVPRGSSLGATWYLPKDDSSNMTRNEMYEQIVGLLGGRVAEALYVGDISVGASNDIDRATKLAKNMVARYGMCERLGTVSYLDDGEVFIGRDFQNTKSYSEKVAGAIDEEVKALIDKAYDHCRTILQKDGEKLQAVAEYLLANESMTGAQFADLMEGREIGTASTTALTDGFEAIDN